MVGWLRSQSMGFCKIAQSSVGCTVVPRMDGTVPATEAPFSLPSISRMPAKAVNWKARMTRPTHTIVTAATVPRPAVPAPRGVAHDAAAPEADTPEHVAHGDLRRLGEDLQAVHDRDRALSDREQRASDDDQAAFDSRHPLGGGSPLHTRTTATRVGTTKERREVRELRGDRASQRDKAAQKRDEVEAGRDREAGALRRVAVMREMLLTAEREAGVELTSQNERLREVDALKDQFVSVVSHQLRTPLTAIRGYLEIVLGEEPGPLNDEQKRFLGIVDFSSKHLLLVVDDLLLIGKVEAGHLELEIDEVDLALMLEACVLTARPSADAKQIGLTLSGVRIAPIAGDVGRLSQAVGNVIANAIKFTTDGRVDVRLYDAADRLVVEVVDTGVGVSASEVAHLFVPFFRAATATQQAIPGTGLGLGIAKEIIEAHGGSITVESEEGLGTSFRIELPRVVS